MTQTTNHPILDAITLMAYVDGELDAQTARDIEMLVETSEDARNLVRMFRESASLTRAALNPVINEPIPARLVAATKLPAPPGAARLTFPTWGHALAASLVLLVVGAAGGFGGAEYSNQIAARHIAAESVRFTAIKDSAIDRAMERTPSGSAYKWQDAASGLSGTITPIRTFRDKKGRYCREFRDHHDTALATPTSIGIACRTKKVGTNTLQPGDHLLRWSTEYQLVPIRAAKGA